MKSLPRILVLAALPTLLLTAQRASPAVNELAPTEITDGWILLFDGATSFGWAPRGDARWDIKDGVIANQPDTGAGMFSTTTEFADFELRLEFWIDDTANSGVFLRCPTEGDVTAANAIEVNIFDPHEQWPTGSLNGVQRAKGTPKTAGKWNTYHLTAEGARITVRLNGETVTEATDPRFQRGTICLQQFNGKGQVKFRDIKLRPLGLKSIFNGKDLSGWTVLPDHKSVFSVTPEGWLNVKNGNGDLQSAGRYGDFVFQLDIISNGTHLNSGIFFRAMPGQFWSGYESQIRNQWEGEDRTKPVDYGTGGVYNRQPARRVVSSDREWFTKTIIATGRHIAVWVNGFQVSDFLDRRPPNENARQGYRDKPGVLSIQGHDPTTDLSFRNLRVAELPPPRL